MACNAFPTRDEVRTNQEVLRRAFNGVRAFIESCSPEWDDFGDRRLRIVTA